MAVMATTRSVPSRKALPRASAAPRVAALSVAALSVTLPAGEDEIQLFPAGNFRAVDGRPTDVDTWRMDGDIARALIDGFNARRRRLVIDYEHATLTAKVTGQPAPASGWIKSLDWREGQGLYAQVNWTKRAKGHIDGDEYRYISPVFTYDKQGRPQALLHAALTNDPALDDLDAVCLAVASAMGLASSQARPGSPLSLTSPPKENPMDQLLKACLAHLGLPEDATEEQALAKFNEHTAKARQDADQVAALTAQVRTKDQEVAALKSNAASAGTPDPAKYVPIAAISDMQAQLVALTRDNRKRDVDELVTAALSANKLIPSMKGWATELGMKDLDQLKAYLESAPAIAALSGTQTGGRAPDGDGSQLSDTEMAVCTSMGLDPAKFKASQA